LYTVGVIKVNFISKLSNPLFMNVIHIFLPQDVFIAIFCNVLDCTVTTTSEITLSSSENCELSHINGIFFGHIPLLVWIQDSISIRTSTALTEQLSCYFLHCFTTIKHLQVNALVVKATYETSETHPWVSLGFKHVTQSHGCFFNGYFPVFL